MSNEQDRPTFEIPVSSTDPQKEDEKPKTNGDVKGKGKDESDEPEMSEEDLQLKGELEMLVQRLREPDTNLYLPALESLRTLIKTSTSSMTSVPKPLKFLRPHFEELQKIREGWDVGLKAERALLASILSVLAMTYSDTGKRDTLHYSLISEVNEEDPGSWGHEYVRHLAAELGEEYNARFVAEVETSEIKLNEKPQDREYPVEDLRALGMELVDFFLKHNAEADAVDLLLELEVIEWLIPKVDEKTWPRVCQYMVGCVPLLMPPDDRAFLRTAAEIYAAHGRYPEALALAIRMNDRELVRIYYAAPKNLIMKKQLSYLLARALVPISWVHTPEDAEKEGEGPAPEQSEDLLACLGNVQLSQHFKNFGKAVGVHEPRSVDSVYKTHLETEKTNYNVDSARNNLAATFVNAFVNAGFSNDKLMVDADEGQSWIYKNKDHGMMSAAASVGMSMIWDSEAGLDAIDKYSYSSEEHIKAGALLAMGILHAGVRTDPDVAFALLEDHVDSKSSPLKIAAMNGLAIAYVGSCRQDVTEKLVPHVMEDSNSMEVVCMAALGLGFVHVGSGDGEVASNILQVMMEKSPEDLESPWVIFMCLALGLVFLGTQDASEATVETLRTIDHPIANVAQILVDVCSYAGTGNVLKIQDMLYICSEHAAPPKKSDASETETPAGSPESSPIDAEGDISMSANAVMGIALVAMGEEVGAEMALRQFQHLMTYGDPIIRKTVPLALGLISASNPQMGIMDTLSKYSHDSDLDVACNAVLAMGLIGAGTNNARLAQMLRGLAVYYHKEANVHFIVRVAQQGLVHMGKGTIGLNPFFNDGQIMSRPAMAGLLALLVSFTDAKNFVLSKHHWMLYWLSTAMYPQFFITLDENLEEKAVTVRVGQAVNTVGLAGTRHGISGFQTHQTPVRIGTGERAELATNEYFPYQTVLEGLVILKKNEQYDAED
ncbi:26S proteasome regulatory subunit N1 [Tremella mesenterica]|uniref:26S proteasome regulatory subunit RPN1 n=1 Tax=Tremella mesenterica TaxID=5217 RepID=A0A4Q1BF97_TREME|nr:26S proteasome regulatory subunit N1 [Tremella mesenterica]